MPFLSSTARIAVSYPSGVSLSGDIVISGTTTNTVLQWRAPPGPFATRNISIVAVGGGNGYTVRVPGVSDGASGSGGNLRYLNNVEVIPNKLYEIAAGRRGTEFGLTGGASYFKDGDTVVLTSGGHTDSYGIQFPTSRAGFFNPVGGGNGGASTIQDRFSGIDSGGGGAGGYLGDGGSGGGGTAGISGTSAFSSGGGAGGKAERDDGTEADIGGGVGLYGVGAGGLAGESSATQGSLGSNGVYGGGAGNLITGAAPGGLRIVWGTSTRLFPSTNVRQKYDYNPLIYTTPTVTTYVVPEGVTSLAFIVVGAGGGSDTVYQESNRASGGGGGGYVFYVYDVVVEPGDTIDLQVGLGGAGGTSTSVGGKTGQESYVRLPSSVSVARNFNYTAGGGRGASGSSAGLAGTGSFGGSNGTRLQGIPSSYAATVGVSGAGGYGGNGGAPLGLRSFAPDAAPANSGGYSGAAYTFGVGSYGTAIYFINPSGGSTGEGSTNTFGAGAGAGGPFSGNFFPNGRRGSNGAVVIFPNQLIRPFTSSFLTLAGGGLYYAR